MAITVTTKSEITVVETLTLGPASTVRAPADTGANTTQLKLGASSTPPVSQKAHFAQALVAGAGSIDLLALIGSQGQTLPTTGLRVQAVKVQNPNAHALTVVPAVSNGYPLTFTVPPQGEVLLTCTNLLSQVGTTCHLLTLSGIGTDSAHWMIILG